MIRFSLKDDIHRERSGRINRTECLKYCEKYFRETMPSTEDYPMIKDLLKSKNISKVHIDNLYYHANVEYDFETSGMGDHLE